MNWIKTFWLKLFSPAPKPAPIELPPNAALVAPVAMGLVASEPAKPAKMLSLVSDSAPVEPAPSEPESDPAEAEREKKEAEKELARERKRLASEKDRLEAARARRAAKEMEEERLRIQAEQEEAETNAIEVEARQAAYLARTERARQRAVAMRNERDNSMKTKEQLEKAKAEIEEIKDEEVFCGVGHHNGMATVWVFKRIGTDILFVRKEVFK